MSGDDVDYVLFKVSQLVDDKTDFNKAADKFLKENPRFSAPSGGTYRAAGAVKGGGSGTAQGSHDAINDRIRNAFRH